MPAFAHTRRNNFRPRRPAKRTDPTRRRAPPSSALINAVIEHADLRDEMGGGRVMLRVSPKRLADPGVLDGLDAEASRLGDVAVIWDEREEVVFRVLDGRPASIAAITPPLSEDDRFALTPAALAYIAGSQSTRRS